MGGTTHWECTPVWFSKFLVLLRGVQGLSGSWADDRSGARSVFSSFEPPMAHKVFSKYFLLFCAASHNAGRAFANLSSLTSDPELSPPTGLPSQANLASAPPSALPPLLQHWDTHGAISCPCEQAPAQQCSRHILLWGRGRKKIFSNLRGKFGFCPHVLFFPPTPLNVRLLHSFFESLNS